MQPIPRQRLISALRCPPASRWSTLQQQQQRRRQLLAGGTSRQFSTSTTRRDSPNGNRDEETAIKTTTTTTTNGTLVRIPPAPPARWITDLRSRIGKCIIFGCSNQQISRASSVLRALAIEWKDLLAGSEGFLTGGRRGLDSQKIAWGEMDSFVGSFRLSFPVLLISKMTPAFYIYKGWKRYTFGIWGGLPNDYYHHIWQGHVNNVNYYRYAESARVNWITNFSVHVDPAHRQEWADLMSPKAIGLIMRSLKADFKFVCCFPSILYCLPAYLSFLTRAILLSVRGWKNSQWSTPTKSQSTTNFAPNPKSRANQQPPPAPSC